MLDNHQSRKKKKEILIPIIELVCTIIMIIFFMIGFTELIDGQSVGIITFYTIITISLLWKLGNLLIEPLDEIFKKGKRQNG